MGGAAVTALLAVVWIGSKWWCVEWHNGTLEEFIIQAGCARATIKTGPSISTSTMNGWYVWRLPPATPFRWQPRYQHARYPAAVVPSVNCHNFYVTLPLWKPLALVTMSTAVVWRIDATAHRRFGLNRCPQCGYDCTGLAKGSVCPECGGPPMSEES